MIARHTLIHANTHTHAHTRTITRTLTHSRTHSHMYTRRQKCIIIIAVFNKYGLTSRQSGTLFIDGHAGTICPNRNYDARFADRQMGTMLINR